MFLLYLDDSGSVANPADTHIVLAGLCVFERKPHWLASALDDAAARLLPNDPHALEFRSVDMLSGKKRWRRIEKILREQAYADSLNWIARDREVRLFGAAVHKAAISPDDPMEYAFEQVCNRFDLFLGRLHKSGNTQRGLIVLDKSAYETSLQGLARDFRLKGHTWGRLHNLADVPLFVDSKATRMIQYADMIAHALRRYFQQGDDRYFRLIDRVFDSEGGVTHGLVHFAPPEGGCNCIACRQKRPGRNVRP